MKALINARIYDYKSYIGNGYIKFSSKIEQVGDMKDFTGEEETIDCSGCIVMPGLTNCHTHIYSTFARGMKLTFNPRSFTEILDQLWWKLDRHLDEAAVYSSALAYGIDCLSSGVTSLIDHHASGLSIEGTLGLLRNAISSSLGMRGIYCFETSDRFPVDKCIEENLSFAANFDEHAAGMFGLHASMSLSQESLKQVASCLGNMPIHIHIAESMDDVQDCYQHYNKSIIERLDGFGLLNKDSILAHCVHINDQEAALIGEKGCYVALNPTSNMNNSVGLPNFENFRKHKIKCLIGNDGLGANITRDYLNLLFSMKNRLGAPTRFTMEDLVKAVDNGYAFFSNRLNIKLGRLEKEYAADFIVMPYDPPTPIDEDNILGHVIYGLYDCFKPKQVWAAGKQLVRDYRPTFAVDKILEEARQEAAKVWKRII